MKLPTTIFDTQRNSARGGKQFDLTDTVTIRPSLVAFCYDTLFALYGKQWSAFFIL